MQTDFGKSILDMEQDIQRPVKESENRSQKVWMHEVL